MQSVKATHIEVRLGQRVIELGLVRSACDEMFYLNTCKLIGYGNPKLPILLHMPEKLPTHCTLDIIILMDNDIISFEYHSSATES